MLLIFFIVLKIWFICLKEQIRKFCIFIQFKIFIQIYLASPIKTKTFLQEQKDLKRTIPNKNKSHINVHIVI